MSDVEESPLHPPQGNGHEDEEDNSSLSSDSMRMQYLDEGELLVILYFKRLDVSTCYCVSLRGNAPIHY